jgi:hypothetical protein
MLMFNRLVPSGEYVIYRKVIWLYLFLLIFEGALRKWILPSLATPLLLIRDPIVIWLVLAGIQKKWFHNSYAVVMMFVGTVSFFLTLFVGHQNLLTALFGWRIYFFYFPLIFVIGKVLTRNDLLKMGRFLLYLSIPMTVLIAGQFYSPQSAWINRGVGGDMEGAGFAGALGYFRPPGIFVFISGYVLFQLLVFCFLLYYLVMNSALDKSQQVKPLLLWIMLFCYIISIPYSISRSHFFQTIVITLFMITGVIQMKQFRSKLVKFALLISTVGIFIGTTGIANDSIAAFTARFDSASHTEKGIEGTIGNRYLGSFIRGLFNDNLPFWGYGTGLGTNIGARLEANGDIYKFFNGEEEWSRITGECGLLTGWIIIAVRCMFCWDVLKKSLQCLKKRKDILPWLLSAGMLLLVPQGQMGATTNLGFLVFMGGIALAAVNKVKNS